MATETPKSRIAYLDCFAGISGDMFLGALLDSGLDPAILHHATSALQLNASLRIETVDRSGIACTKVDVLAGNALAEPVYNQPVTQPSQPSPDQHQHAHAHAAQPADALAEPHAHLHTQARSLTDIRALIQASGLSAAVRQTAIHSFELLGASEARIHNVHVDQIHFHEVGAIDAIVDIVAASAGIHALNDQAIAATGQPLQWHCSPLNVGGGMVDCAHGRFPVPAPATADLLRGLPTYSAHIQKELVTPTGAALLRTLNPTFGPQPAMSVTTIGYGAGTRNPQGFPNALRLSLGEADAGFKPAGDDTTTVTVLETALDDLSPQILATIIDGALALGALDAMLTSVLMKKGRPGTLITILTDEQHRAALEDLLLTQTTTLGIRIRRDRRTCLDRTHTTVTTPFGDIRIKLGTRNGKVLNAAPEFEDCRTAAATHNAPVKQVIQAANAAYLSSQTR